jgi:hypothetical protein
MVGSISARAIAAGGLAVAIALLAVPAAAAVPARPGAAGLTFRNDELLGVSCVAGHGCVAVGSRHSSTSTTTKALAETRGSFGGSWTVHDPPGIGGALTVGFGPIGNGETVSCVARPFTCVGIGSYNKGGHQFNYAAKWNGKSWKTVNPPNPQPTVSSGLDAISCRSATFCLVVGHWLSFAKPSDRLESLVWNGRKWTLKSGVPLPAKASGARLWGLSCVSVTWCMAVGSYNVGSAQPVLSEVWNGRKWTIHRPPSPKHVTGSALLGVSCLSKTFCNAVGDSLNSQLAFLSLGETWNGTSWVIRPTPSGTQTIGSVLFDVKCRSRTSCLAVGDMAATWNGAAWHGVHFPVPSGSPLANAVSLSCLSAKQCTAAGSYAHGASTLAAAWNWNGTSLTLQSTPNP